MITEDYVSFETAKLLKEKGFDEYTISYYDKNGSFGFNEVDTRVSNGYQRPTIQMTMKWLREVHDKSIEVRSQGLKSTGLGWVIEIYNLKNQDEEYHDPSNQPSYEEACEAAIKYCLENLI